MVVARFAALLLLVSAPALAGDGRLAFFINGEARAIEGFQAPELTKDGWAIAFDCIVATIADVAAYRADPPFEAAAAVIAGPSVALAGTFRLDLTEAGEDGRVKLGEAAAPEGHYNALAWSLVPAGEGEFAGYSLVFVGTATRDGQSVGFTPATRERHDYACGE